MIQEYVLGFVFNLDKTKVALMRKTKPEWQRGRLNGIGGKIELGETSITAMHREFKEETGQPSNTNPETNAGINKIPPPPGLIQIPPNKYTLRPQSALMTIHNHPPVENKIQPITNLYPFEETLRTTTEEKAIIEKIDIGGPSMIRAAAKNYEDVVIIPSQKQYAKFLIPTSILRYII
jgi:8-oxo-dGTP pyrophosphatase MutT (NUDIX family)